jgi:hypothetical protein
MIVKAIVYHQVMWCLPFIIEFTNFASILGKGCPWSKRYIKYSLRNCNECIIILLLLIAASCSFSIFAVFLIILFKLVLIVWMQDLSSILLPSRSVNAEELIYGSIEIL